jgi:hypothetical protein
LAGWHTGAESTQVLKKVVYSLLSVPTTEPDSFV